VELPFYIFFTLFRGCKARGYGGGTRVRERYNNNTTPEIVGRGGYFAYRLPNTEHCIAYTEYRIQNACLIPDTLSALFLTHCCHYLDTLLPLS
jgi:hypothetical protein